MIRPSCSVCGFGYVLGRLENWPNTWLCPHCKEMTLRAMYYLGVQMTAENIFIHDLCSGHYSDRVGYQFNYQNKDGEWKHYYILPPVEVTISDSEINTSDPLDSL